MRWLYSWTVSPLNDLCPISTESWNGDSLSYPYPWRDQELLRTNNYSDRWNYWGQIPIFKKMSFELEKSLDCDQNCCLFLQGLKAPLSFGLSAQSSSCELHVSNSSTDGLDDKGSSVLWEQLFIAGMATPTTRPTMISTWSFSAFWNLLEFYHQKSLKAVLKSSLQLSLEVPATWYSLSSSLTDKH